MSIVEGNRIRFLKRKKADFLLENKGKEEDIKVKKKKEEKIEYIIYIGLRQLNIIAVIVRIEI